MSLICLNLQLIVPRLLPVSSLVGYSDSVDGDGDGGDGDGDSGGGDGDGEGGGGDGDGVNGAGAGDGVNGDGDGDGGGSDGVTGDGVDRDGVSSAGDSVGGGGDGVSGDNEKVWKWKVFEGRSSSESVVEQIQDIFSQLEGLYAYMYVHVHGKVKL